jgi:tryptophanyl-tRNA synthetase
MSVPACARCRPTAASRRLGQLLRASPKFSQQRRWQSTDEPGVETTPAADAPGAVIFSGIQPTGVPHLGNYLGAMRQWKRLQDQAGPNDKLYFSVVDLHAITMPQDAPVLRQRSREMLAALIAIGLAPRKSTLFYQSSVPAHSELMWILSCTASMGYLGRMTQWKVCHVDLTAPWSAPVWVGRGRCS